MSALGANGWDIRTAGYVPSVLPIINIFDLCEFNEKMLEGEV